MRALIWAFLAVTWGTTWLAVRVGLESLPPFTFAGLRFVLAALLLAPMAFRQGRALVGLRGVWPLMLGTAVLAFVLAYGLQFWGQQFVASGLAAVMFATVPLWGMLLAHWALPGERITWSKALGVGLGVAGVAVVFADQLVIADVRGAAACAGFLIASFAMAISQVLVKARGRGIPPAVLSTVQMAVGGAVLLTVGVSTGGNPLAASWSPSAVAALVYLAVIGSVVAFVAFYWLLVRLDVTKVLSMMLVHPIVALVLGWVVRDEVLGPRTLAGGATILIGLALVIYARPVPRVAPQRPAAVAGLLRFANRLRPTRSLP